MIFDVGGNKFRLVVHVAYAFKRVLIKFVGTHEDYEDRSGDRLMDVRPIKTEADYDWAFGEISRYFDQQPSVGSPEGDRFEVLSDLIVAYEERRYPLPEIDPIDALEALLRDSGRSQADLAVLFGSRSRASEVLNRKRALTIEMIHRLHKEWGAPPELLLKPYQLAA